MEEDTKPTESLEEAQQGNNQSEPKPKPEPEPEPQLRSEPQSEVGAQPEPRPQHESKPQPESLPKPELESHAEPQLVPRAELQHQPQSIPSWRTYNGPKLYVKPKIRNSNAQIIHKAVAKALEGAADALTLKKMKETIDSNQGTCGHFLILFRNNKFKGIYDYSSKLETVSKLDGIGPKSVNVDDIVRFYKYDLSKRQFVQVETKHIGPTIIGFSIANSKPRQ